MKEIRTALGIVLKRQALANGDLLLSLLTESGEIISCKAHGIQKSRRRSHNQFQAGNKLTVNYYPSAGAPGSIQNSQLISDGTQQRPDYHTLQRLAYALECMYLFNRFASNPAMYLLLEGYLQNLRSQFRLLKSELQQEQILLDIFLKIRLLNSQGLAGDLEHCTMCGQVLAEKIYWDLPQLSFACHDCANTSSQQNMMYATILKKMLTNRFPILLARQLILPELPYQQSMPPLQELDRLLHSVIQHELGHPLKSAQELYDEPLLSKQQNKAYRD